MLLYQNVFNNLSNKPANQIAYKVDVIILLMGFYLEKIVKIIFNTNEVGLAHILFTSTNKYIVYCLNVSRKALWILSRSFNFECYLFVSENYNQVAVNNRLAQSVRFS